MFFEKSRPQPAPLAPDVEKGPKTHTDEPPVESERNAGATGEPSAEDDSDSNDKFWKLFLEEAASEAKWKVSIWQTELDSLLVFAGLFAGIVSAFLVDLRSHLRPDPQVVVLSQIVSILRNQTSPTTSDSDFDSGPSPSTLAVGYLWYGSLVATLIGALWGVLAKGWLGETLREPPNNPVDRALERWRRDKAAKRWYMEHVITGVPLLTQIGLTMFLTGFVVQSLGDDRGIGIQVLFYVTLGTIAYAGFTFVSWLRPECPYRTPLTKFLHFGTRVIPSKGSNDANTKSKIQILVSKLNRSSNDEIFCSAASVLDGKLESHDSRKWYKGVEKHASEIADALSVRLKSFAHRVKMITEGPQSLSRILKDTVSSDSNGDAFVGTFYSPIEQGIACLRVLLGSIEASITYGTDKSPWIKQDIDRQWRVSKIFPATWRMLSLSIHITKLVAKKMDFKADDIAEIDWDNLIRKTFPDTPLRSISGASACRGLMQGEANLKRACAIGIATFVEIEATTPTNSEKQVEFEEHDWIMVTNASEVVTQKVWNEHVSMWKDIVLQLLRETYEWTEPENSMYELMDYASGKYEL
ncbi:hypothetical protein BDN70DRAFT_618218 [Pholiota conissans]|uniref:DUF6535 domain-containing protein n=1 Tax=Pholiota conissans TaxID=109636 RepID=A0A9P5Z462_9AGAR|nr:hypothetical protein BDN70DRAFT_618218 [Pholiota conissans]